MIDQHPITPPDELKKQWMGLALSWQETLNVAAQWGADQELEACCEWLAQEGYIAIPPRLRAARRPKPPSLKEQALLQLDTLNADLAMHGRGCDLSQIRRALEQLNDH